MIFLIEDGIVDAQAMFRTAHQSNTFMTWLFRLAGFIAMLVGLNMILRPLSVLVSILPFLSRVVSAGTGLISFLAAAILSIVTIAFAWLAYRPLIGVPLLVVAGALAVGLRRKLKAGKEPSYESM